MNVAIKCDPTNGFKITDNDEILASVLKSLARNNTFCPNVTKIRKVNRKGKDTLIVSFADGTWVEVTRSKDDSDDDAMALLYAIAKRLFGKPTTGGYVEGDGFMTKVKALVASIKTEKDIEREKAERIKAKEAEDAKKHKEAMERHERHPTLGYRMRKLEENVNRLVEALSEGKCNCGCSDDKDKKGGSGRFFKFSKGK